MCSCPLFRQLDPTAELIKQLQEENAKLLAQLQSMGSEEIEKERREWEQKLQAADSKVQESQKALEERPFLDVLWPIKAYFGLFWPIYGLLRT